MRVSRGITQDAEFEELGRRGYIGNLNDRQYKLLGNIGLRGALTDRIGSSGISAYALAAVDNKLPPLVMDFKEEDYFSNNTIGSFAEVAEHSRAGNATMTDSSGNIVWAPHNLLTYSEDFSNAAWTKSNTTVTANAAVAPDGTTTADKWTNDSTNTSVTKNITVVSGTEYVFAAFVKYIDNQWIKFSFDGSLAWFDVQNGVVGTDNLGTCSVTALADGWYMLSGTKTTSDTTFTAGIVLADGDNSNTETSGTSAYIWGAHVYRNDLGGMADVPASERAFTTATKYVPTTDAARYLPRVNHHVYNGSQWVNKGLFVESEARTNLVTYSEDFTDASWTGNRIGSIGVDATGPDGGTSATTLVDSGATGNNIVQIFNNVTVSASTVHTFSVFLKKDQLNWASLRAINFTTPGNSAVWFDLENGVVGTEQSGLSGHIVDYGNGWYRCAITFTTDATDTSGSVYIRLADGDADETVDLDGTSSILIYGAQFEAGSTPSSYIPTNGATVTRPAETITIPAANLPWPNPVYVTGEELVDTANVASSWVVYGTNTVSDVADGVEITYVDSSAGAYLYLRESGGLSSDLVNGSVYEVTLDAKVSGGSANFRIYDGVSYILSQAIGGSEFTTYSFVLTKTTTGDPLINLDNFSAGEAVTFRNISVKEINPLALSIQMKGEMTYADEGETYQVLFWRWYLDSQNDSRGYVDTSGAFTGVPAFSQRDSGINDVAFNTSIQYSPDILVPFNIASRHGSTFVNGAVDGVALTANTTPVALPDLENTDLELAYDFMGTISLFRIWADDLGDTGIEEATEPSTEATLFLSFDGFDHTSYIDFDWSE